jgi:two-component system CheB/CheR fusion protein
MSSPLISQKLMKKNNSDLHVVGIGASSGGLNALKELFDHTPSNTGMVFVIIQHLSPDFVSLMPELLSKHTSMEIYTAQDKLTIKPNCIYLNQRKSNLYIKGRELYLLDKGSKHNLNLPIDIFFHTLGEEYKEKSIGIILSGTGSDGSRGIKTIKEGGGIVIVQEPNSTQFDGMPNAAIATNDADFILSPEDIGGTFNELLINSLSLSSKEYTSKSSEFLIESILTLIFKHSGTDFREYKRNTILRRIEKRMGVNNIDELHDYHTYLLSNEAEKKALNQNFLINVTRFFRDEEAFHLMETKIIPAICNSIHKNEQLRVWCAGCSTGEEVYSIAILIADYISIKKLNLDFKIFATDIDSIALNAASLGEFHINTVNEIRKEHLEQYFIKSGLKIKISKQIREKIVFSNHNVCLDPPFIKMDLITCRNLFIYLDNKVQSKIMKRFHFSLNKFGYLFLGNSESLGDISKKFKTIDTKWKIFQNIDEEKSLISKAGAYNVDSVINFKTPKQTSFSKTFKYQENPELVFHKYLSTKFSPDAIFIDKEYNIIFISGDAGSRLSHNAGLFQRNLLKNIKPQIATIIRNGIRRLESEQKDISIKDIINQQENVTYQFDLTIYKPKDNKDLQDTYVLEFSKNTKVNKTILEIKDIPYDEISQAKHEYLENELTATKTELQNVVEELETSNEELQSSNEELIASNEELQSTNEELQSVNEELYTANSELQKANKKLQLSTNDINNIFNSSDIGTLFLDTKLCIRRFTPSLKDLFKLQESDYGRPIATFTSNFSHNIKETILINSKKALDRQHACEEEVMDSAGNYYLVKTSPYITQDKKIEGIVISFIDIAHIKRTEAELKRSIKMLNISQASAKLGGWELDITTNNLFWTDETYRILDTSPETHTPSVDDGVSLYLAKSQEIVSNALEKAIKKGTGYDLELEIYTKKGRILNVRTTCIVTKNNGKPTKLTGVFQDITLQKNIERALTKAKEKAEESDELKSAFLANMSHEIRTPMNGILGFTSLLQEPKLKDEDKKTYVDIIEKSGNRMLTTVNDIINISKIETGQMEVTLTAFNVSKEIENLYLFFKAEASKKGIALKLKNLLLQNEPIITSDLQKLNGVFINLIKNALKFIDHGSIEITIDKKGKLLACSIKDTGIGIPKKRLKAIFNRFTQADISDVRAFQGSGLGLTISKAYIELLGGKLWVESEVGIGTTFYFNIPI